MDLTRRSVWPPTATENSKHGLTRQAFWFCSENGVRNEKSSHLCLIRSWRVVDRKAWGGSEERKGVEA